MAVNLVRRAPPISHAEFILGHSLPQTPLHNISLKQTQELLTPLPPLPPPMSSCSKKRHILNTVSVNLGCSSGCKRPRLSGIFRPKPRDKPHHYHSSSSSWNATTDTPPASDTDSDIKSLRAVQGFGKIGGESLAVEKDSNDPYLDFRHSMLQMILEKEIYSKDDLKELLNCFLRLNSPYYHGIIVRAFTEIWNGVY